MGHDRYGNFVWHREIHEGSTARFGIVTHVDEGQNPGPFVATVFHESIVWDASTTAGLQEAAAARAELKHTSVPRLVEYEVAAERSGASYAIFDYVPGVAADVLERRAAETSRRLALVVAARITADTARTVDEVVNELGPDAIDIDLANVRIGWDGGVSLTLPIVVPNHASANESTPSANRIRLPSPEAIEGRGITKQSLVFTLGVMLYRLVESRHPYQGSSPMETFMRITDDRPDPLVHPSPELDAIVSRALDRDPKRRFQSPGDFADAIARGLAPAPRTVVGAEISALCPSERQAEIELLEDFGSDATLTDPADSDEPTLVDDLSEA